MIDFTDRELRLIRAEQETAMPERVEIQRKLRVNDGFGGSQNTVWTPIASNLPARVTMGQTLDMGGQAARKMEVEKWTVRLPWATDVKEHDRILWDGIAIAVDEIKTGSYRSAKTVAGERVK